MNRASPIANLHGPATALLAAIVVKVSRIIGSASGIEHVTIGQCRSCSASESSVKYSLTCVDAKGAHERSRHPEIGSTYHCVLQRDRNALAFRYAGLGVIFMLHSTVGKSDTFLLEDLRCPVAALEWILSWLKDKGVQFVSLDEAMQRSS